MTASGLKTPHHAIRGPVLTFKGDPFKDGLESTMVYEPDAIVAFGLATSPTLVQRTKSSRNYLPIYLSKIMDQTH